MKGHDSVKFRSAQNPEYQNFFLPPELQFIPKVNGARILTISYFCNSYAWCRTGTQWVWLCDLAYVNHRLIAQNSSTGRNTLKVSLGTDENLLCASWLASSIIRDEYNHCTRRNDWSFTLWCIFGTNIVHVCNFGIELSKRAIQPNKHFQST